MSYMNRFNINFKVYLWSYLFYANLQLYLVPNNNNSNINIILILLLIIQDY